MEPTSKVTLHRPWLLVFAGLFLVAVVAGAIWYARSHLARAVVKGLVTDPQANLQSTGGATNVVLLGIGGEGHDGPDLTDSIIFLSYNHSSHAVSFLSLPRDIWIDSMKAKLNTAYHYGNEKREGGGRDLVKSAVAEVTGQPVHYVLVLDFQGFVKAIDAVGGVDVNVERAFDDYKYPIPGKENAEPESARYEHIHFNAGLQHMDGATALKFARSRHAEGDEGTDFARSARQEKIITAFKEKLVSTQTLLDFNKLKSVFESLQSSIDTDIPEDAYGSFFKVFMAYENTKAPMNVLNIDELLVNPKNTLPYQGQWVLVPARSWQDVYTYVAQKLGQ